MFFKMKSCLSILIGIMSSFCFLISCKQQEIALRNFIQQGDKGIKRPREEKPVANIYEFSGQISLKPKGESNWTRVAEKMDLFAGDSVFVHKDGTIHIEYYGAGASLMMKEFSFFIVGKNPPGYSRFKRKSGYGNSSIGFSREQSNDSAVAKPTMEGAKKSTSVQQNLGIQMQRDITRILVIEPLGDVHLFARNFPTLLSVKFEKTWDEVGLWCFVWSTSAHSSEPVWVGFRKGSVQDIPIEKPGNYIVQIITEDESRTTRPIVVSAKKRENGLPKFFPEISFAVKNSQPLTVDYR